MTVNEQIIDYMIRYVETELDWVVTHIDNNVYCFEKCSPAGMNFLKDIDTENEPELFLHNIYETYSNFDVSYETYLWIGSDGHGANGAPYDIKDIYEDMEECRNMLEELWLELKKAYKSVFIISVNYPENQNYTPASVMKRWAKENYEMFNTDAYGKAYIHMSGADYFYDSWNIETNNDGTDTVNIILRRQIL